MTLDIGKKMYSLAEELFPICRSITGNGVRETFKIISSYLPDLKTYEIPSGTICFDWTIPQEWNIYDAYIKNLQGEKIVDFKVNNLHVVNYSTPVDETIGYEELRKHLYSLPKMPDAIPYVTSYYQKNWGFCLTHNLLEKMTDKEYQIKIDSQLSDGSLTYAEIIIPGESEKEIFLSTYVCHPSMGNNETSGPVLATFLAKYISSMSRKFSYRIIFVPETIGAVAYLSKNLGTLKKNVHAGFQLTCVGDNREYSYLPSRKGNTITDKIMKHALKHKVDAYKAYTFHDRGSDERQYCSPGVDLPFASIMRSKYGQYEEYHTSKDDLSLISAEGFLGSYDIHVHCINLLEKNEVYVATGLCEPQLGKRGLRSNAGVLGQYTANFRLISEVLAYADGNSDLIDLAEELNIYALDLVPTIELLIQHELIRKI